MAQHLDTPTAHGADSAATAPAGAPRSRTRRLFLAASSAGAGGLMLGFALPLPLAHAQRATLPLTELNAWVLVHPDERVVIRIARSEMGQGTLTGLAQLVAEELQC
ncbi:MAG: hypothetical protein CFE45_17180, partial [Burkholderiales bacterium PBB5]